MDMEINLGLELHHEYAVGGLEQIKKGGDLELMEDLDLAKSCLEKKSQGTSLICVPRIIGVYRRAKVILSQENSTGKLERRSETVPYEGCDVHPGLVQIGYSTDMNLPTIANFIGEESNRIKIVPYTELKTPGEDLKKYSEISRKRMNPLEEKMTEKEMAELVRLYSNLLSSEGLMQNEYNIFQNFKELSLIL